MKIDTVVTLDGQDKYYLADEYIENGIKFFIANKLDENSELTDETCIFSEETDETGVYLDEVDDEEVKERLLAIFASNFVAEVDALPEEA